MLARHALKCVSLSLLTATFATASQAATFTETFESYAAGSQLAGQGGWYQSTIATAPLVLSSGTGLSSIVADGLTRTGDGPYCYCNRWYSSVQHSVAGVVDLTQATTLDADAYAFSAYQSHASGIALIAMDGSSSAGWYADWYDSVDRNQPKWQFVTPGGNEVFKGGFDSPVHLQVVLDGAAGTIYGRLTHPAGVYETAHFSATLAEMAALSEVAISQDFRDSYLGVEIDNITVGVVPEPTTYLLLLTGLAVLRVVAARRSEEAAD